MRLILFRHGPAGSRDPERWPDDGVRPLTAKGGERVELAGRALRKLEGTITVILTSPLVRARQTADRLEASLDCRDGVEVLDALSPGGSYRQVIARCAEFGADDLVMLVGHEPDLGKLAGTLVFGAPAALPLKKSGACAIDFEAGAHAGAGRLHWLLPPRVLRRLSGHRSKV